MSIRTHGPESFTVAGMARENKKPRGIRVTDSVWEAAKAEADRRGEFLNAAIDRFLVDYANGADNRARR